MLIYSPFWFNFNLKNIIVKLLIGYNHLWYLIATLLSAFFLLIYVRKIKNNKGLFFLSIGLFSIGTSLQYIGSSHIFENFDTIDQLLNMSFIYRNFLFVGIPFFSIGYLMRLKKDEIDVKKLNRILIASIVLLLLETILNYVFFNEENDLLFSLLLCSPLVFWFFLKFEINSNINSKKVSLYSTSLYLIHPLVMVAIYKQLQLNSILLAVFTVLISFIISFFLIILHKKLKFIL